MSFVLFPDEVTDKSAAGGKAFALARLHRATDAIPDWFVIAPEAFHASLDRRQQQVVGEADFEFDDLGTIALPEELSGEIEAALAKLCPNGAQVAVRSSAVEEDSAKASFAGQLESFLSVAHHDVLERVKDVWRSGFTARVREYRRGKGLVGEPSPPAVLVQRMVAAETSGVAFSSDPVSGDRTHCVVSSVAGLGDKLVSGEVEGAVYHVSQDGTVSARSAAASDDALTEAKARDVAAIARQAETHFGLPQDIEWAFADGKLFLLQSRPITTLPAAQPDEGRSILWDNSNIVESYSGVTSPLTFSFARHVYDGVYRQFLSVLGVSDRTIERNANTFRNMLGFVQGRVYYNLLNWYRLIALLPGFAANRHFMEQMMGVSRTLPSAFIERIAPPEASLAAKLRAIPTIAVTLIGIIANWILLPRKITSFYRRLDAALSKPLRELEAMRLDELGDYYRRIEADLLANWQAPILNDFFCMIFFGLSRQLLSRWCGEAGEALHNDLLAQQGGMISTEPARRVTEMAVLAARDRVLAESLASGDRARWTAAIEADPAFKAKYDEYIEAFGDRCLQELKLESPTLYDDPTTLARTIGNLALHPRPSGPLEPTIDAEAALSQHLTGHPMRRVLARWLIGQARRRVQARENLRFERTRVFGRARRIFIEIGERLAVAGLLDRARDIFYLEVPEVLGTIEGTATTVDLKGLVRVRKADAAHYRSLPDPAQRFETRGAVASSALRAVPDLAPEATVGTATETERSGLGCSPGIVRGPVHVITEPAGLSLRPGEILVARHTDPGWVLLFANAAGVLVERGSLLSHSAIVAREMGIPAVVSIPGLLDWLGDGDEVEMDGARGLVRRLSHADD